MPSVFEPVDAKRHTELQAGNRACPTASWCTGSHVLRHSVSSAWYDANINVPGAFGLCCLQDALCRTIEQFNYCISAIWQRLTVCAAQGSTAYHESRPLWRPLLLAMP
jgi:hypothetical protein